MNFNVVNNFTLPSEKIEFGGMQLVSAENIPISINKTRGLENQHLRPSDLSQNSTEHIKLKNKRVTFGQGLTYEYQKTPFEQILQQFIQSTLSIVYSNDELYFSSEECDFMRAQFCNILNQITSDFLADKIVLMKANSLLIEKFLINTLDFIDSNREKFDKEQERNILKLLFSHEIQISIEKYLADVEFWEPIEAKLREKSRGMMLECLSHNPLKGILRQSPHLNT